jgi:hypothetical protein
VLVTGARNATEDSTEPRSAAEVVELLSRDGLVEDLTRRRWGTLRRFGNYLGQLRLYSYVDLALLLLAAGAATHQLWECSLLWFGFLVFLEWKHEDAGRARWPAWVWATLWAGALIFVQSPAAVPFIVLSVAYAYKKQIPTVAAYSFVLNGGLKTSLLLLIPGASLAFAGVVWAATSLRNLLGDFRDIEKDRPESVRTLPVRVGLQRDIKWLYPACLGATTLTWIALGGLPLWTAPIAWIVQGAVYKLTPRGDHSTVALSLSPAPPAPSARPLSRRLVRRAGTQSRST